VRGLGREGQGKGEVEGESERKGESEGLEIEGEKGRRWVDEG